MITRLGGDRPRALRVDSLEEFDRRAARAHRMRGWHVDGLDLRERGEALEGLDPKGAVFAGCRLPDGAAGRLRAQGAYVLGSGAWPRAVPREPAALYSAEQLYAGLGEGPYEAVPDARLYAWARRHLGVAGEQPGRADGARAATRTAALHDHAITTALQRAVSSGPLRSPAGLVGVMGGHGVDRGSAGYADAVRLGGALVRAGARVATGGGPGAMEAAALGGYLASLPGVDPFAVTARLATVPRPDPSPGAWARVALEVLQEHPGGTPGLGVPTWFYGHEPPHVFATHVAKYFSNAQREDVLLAVATGGTVVLPGAAGTVQEVFQEACDGIYGAPEAAAPTVLVGREFWTSTLPAWDLLSALVQGTPLEHRVHLVDSVDEVLPALGLSAG